MDEDKNKMFAPAYIRTILAVAVFAGVMFSGIASRAQDPAAPPEQAVPMPETRQYDLELREKLAGVLNAIKAQDVDGTRTGLKDIENRCLVLGVTSHEELSAAMVKEGKLLQDAKDFNGAMALYDSAIRISPSYPPPYYAEGWGYLAQNKMKALKTADAFIDGFTKSFNDFWWSFFYTGNKFTSVLFTLAVLFSLFGLLTALRYTPLFAHDIAELIKKPREENNFKYLILPGLMLFVLAVLGYWWASTLVFLTLWVYFNKKEKALAIIFFVLLFFMPDIMANFAAFAGAGGNRQLWVMDYINKGRIQKGAKQYLQKTLADQPDNELALMSLAMMAKKENGYQEAADYYNQVITKDPASPIYRNNLGNVLFLANDLDGAIKEYSTAIQYDPGSAVAYFNLSQAYGERLMFTEREQSDGKARDLDPLLVATLRERAGENRVSMVFDEPIPVREFWNIAFADTSGNKSLADSLWSTTVKVLPLQGARVAAVGFIVLTLAINALRRKGSSAHYCQKCGKVTCKKCQRPHYSKELCPQCHQIFVKLEGVEAKERVRKMLEVREKQRKEGLLYRVVSLVLPGAGHFLMGYPLKGFIFMGITIFVIKDIFFGAFYSVPYDFALSVIQPDIIALGLIGLFIYLIAQLDTRRLTK